MRIRPDLYEEIRRDAEANGRSISAQAERRLVHREPTENDVGRLVGMIVDAVEARAGKTWHEDVSIKKRCRSAADFALTVLLGPENDSDKRWTGQKIADEILGEVLGDRHGDEELFTLTMKDKS